MLTDAVVDAGLGCDVDPVPGDTDSQPASESADAWNGVALLALLYTVTVCGGGLAAPAVVRNNKPAGWGSGLAVSGGGLTFKNTWKNCSALSMPDPPTPI